MTHETKEEYDFDNKIYRATCLKIWNDLYFNNSSLCILKKDINSIVRRLLIFIWELL